MIVTYIVNLQHPTPPLWINSFLLSWHFHKKDGMVAVWLRRCGNRKVFPKSCWISSEACPVVNRQIKPGWRAMCHSVWLAVLPHRVAREQVQAVRSSQSCRLPLRLLWRTLDFSALPASRSGTCRNNEAYPPGIIHTNDMVKGTRWRMLKKPLIFKVSKDLKTSESWRRSPFFSCFVWQPWFSPVHKFSNPSCPANQLKTQKCGHGASIPTGWATKLRTTFCMRLARRPPTLPSAMKLPQGGSVRRTPWSAEPACVRDICPSPIVPPLVQNQNKWW